MEAARNAALAARNAYQKALLDRERKVNEAITFDLKTVPDAEKALISAFNALGAICKQAEPPMVVDTRTFACVAPPKETAGDDSPTAN